MSWCEARRGDRSAAGHADPVDACAEALERSIHAVQRFDGHGRNTFGQVELLGVCDVFGLADAVRRIRASVRRRTRAFLQSGEQGAAFRLKCGSGQFDVEADV